MEPKMTEKVLVPPTSVAFGGSAAATSLLVMAISSDEGVTFQY